MVGDNIEDHPMDLSTKALDGMEFRRKKGPSIQHVRGTTGGIVLLADLQRPSASSTPYSPDTIDISSDEEVETNIGKGSAFEAWEIKGSQRKDIDEWAEYFDNHPCNPTRQSVLRSKLALKRPAERSTTAVPKCSTDDVMLANGEGVIEGMF